MVRSSPDTRSGCVGGFGVAVADRATLDAWIAHLDGLGVAHGDVTRGATGDLIAFRDPDNIALEFYTRG